MNTYLNKRSLGFALVAASLAVVTGCGMMGRDKEGEEHGGARAGMMDMGRMQSVMLSGANEVPAVSTGAAASGTITVGRDRHVKVRIVATGMNATAAHIHMGAMGVNGPVIVPLTKAGDNTFVAADDAMFTKEQHEAWEEGRTYINVHSAGYPGGEVRVQLKGK